MGAALLFCALIAGFALQPAATQAAADDAEGTALTAEGGALSSGSYYLDSDLALESDLSVNGTEVVIDLAGHTLTGTGSGHVITVDDGGSLTIVDSTAEDAVEVEAEDLPEEVYSAEDEAFTAGSFDNGDGTVTTYWAVDEGSSTSYYRYTSGAVTGGSITSGGGLCVSGGSSLVLEGGTVWGNEASSFGGGAYVTGSSTLRVSGGLICGNSATTGGGAYVTGSSTLQVAGGGIADNQATASGGGVYATGSSVLRVSGGAVADNSAASYGGGAYIDGCGLRMSGGSICGNVADTYGGGVYGDVAALRISGGSIAGNGSGNGGGVYGSACALTVSGGTVSGNEASSLGGGAYLCEASSLQMSGGSLSANKASSGGGAYLADSSVLEVSGGTVSGNAGGFGGGIYLRESSGTMDAGSVSGNSATASGGGLYVYCCSFSMSGGTISGNTASTAGGGAYVIGSGSSLAVDGSTAVITDNSAERFADDLYLATSCSRSITAIAGAWTTDMIGLRADDDSGEAVNMRGLEDEGSYALHSEVTGASVSYNANVDAGGAGLTFAQWVGASSTLAEGGEFVAPQLGWHVASWNTKADGSGTSYEPGASAESIATAEEDLVLYAQWAVSSYTVSAAAGEGGSATVVGGDAADGAGAGSATVEYGGSASVQISADEGYEISDVLVDGESVGAQDSYSFEDVTADHEVTAVFEPVPSSLCISASCEDAGEGYEDLTFTAQVSYSDGTSQTVELSADNDWSWSSEGLEEGLGYTVRETDIPAGYALAGISGEGTGTIAAGASSQVEICNSYAAAGELVIGTSVLPEGCELLQDGSGFCLLDEDGRVVALATSEADGGVTFDALDFDEGDVGQVYNYEIRALEDVAAAAAGDAGAGAGAGCEAASCVVRVGDAGDGTLTFDVTYLDADGDVVDEASSGEAAAGADGEAAGEGWLSISNVFDDDDAAADASEGVSTFHVVLSGLSDEDLAEGLAYSSQSVTVDEADAAADGDAGADASATASDAADDADAGWVPITSAGGTLAAGLNYYVPEDLQLESDLVVVAGSDGEGAQVTIDLRGNTLSGTGEGSVVTVEEGASLVLIDSSGDDSGAIIGGSATSGGGIYLEEGASLSMTGGSISGNEASASGAGVYVAEGASFTLGGGLISGNTAGASGGGLCVDGGSFTLSGGSICENSAASSGGGLYSTATATLLVSGGSVSGNSATLGGGLYLDDSSSALTGGRVCGNSASCGGAGLYVSAGSFAMSGGSVSGNEASDGEASAFGGGIAVHDGAAFTLSGGAVFDNAAGTRGGGIEVADISTFTLTGGLISGNAAGSTGGGVCVGSGSTFTATGGTICGNSAKCGGGAYVSSEGSGSTSTSVAVSSEAVVIAGNDATTSADDLSIGSGAERNITAIAGSWSTDASGARCDDGAGSGVDMSALADDEGYPLHASLAGASVAYDANGGAGEGFAQWTVDGSALADGSEFEREGCSFAGWNTAADGSGTAYAAGDVADDIAEAGASVTLYAQWEASGFTISAEAGEHGSIQADGAAVEGATVDAGDSLTLTIVADADYAVADVVVDGESVGAVDAYTFEDVDAEHTISASFRYANYALSLDANGGSGSAAAVQHATSVPDCDFYWYGHRFTGWNTKADGSGVSYAPGEAIELDADTTLYAQWAAEEGYSAIDSSSFSLTLAAGESQTICLPEGVGYLVYEDTPSGWELVESSGAEGTIAAGETATAEFVHAAASGDDAVAGDAAAGDGDAAASNAWTPAASVSLTSLSGTQLELEAGQFDFVVIDEAGQVVSTGTNDAEGAVSFDAVEYDSEDAGQTYEYRIAERAGDDAACTYDETVYTAEVAVEDAGDGAVTASATYYDAEGTQLAATSAASADGTAAAATPAFASVYDQELAASLETEAGSASATGTAVVVACLVAVVVAAAAVVAVLIVRKRQLATSRGAHARGAHAK